MNNPFVVQVAVIASAVYARAGPVITHRARSSPDYQSVHPSHQCTKVIIDTVSGFLFSVSLLALIVYIARLWKPSRFEKLVNRIVAVHHALMEIRNSLTLDALIQRLAARIVDGNDTTDHLPTTQ